MKAVVCVILSVLFVCSVSVTAQVQKYSPLCTKGDDYATAFRTTKNGMEIWLNTSNGMKNSRSRHLVRIGCGSGSVAGAVDVLPAPVNQQEESAARVYLDGSPTFSYCDTAYGIFISNRLYNGKNMDNDLYELRNVNGVWNVRRMDELCSEYWDDSPTLSKDGNLLFFATTRDNPGTGLTNIYYSIRSGSGWSAPQPLSDVNTLNFKEEAPFLGSDGFLYFSTNRDGDLDIYRIRIDEETGKPMPPEEPVPFAGVNQRGSDEAVPTLSAGGAWLIFSSNRGEGGKTKDYDIYTTRIGQGNDTIPIQVLLRTREFNKYVEEWEDMIIPCTTDLTATDRQTNSKGSFKLDNQGKTVLVMQRAVSNDPCDDYRYREIILKPSAPSMQGKEFIAETDTVLVDVLAAKNYSHTMYVWDKAILTDKQCVQNFPITEVQFFLTCYWCPTSVQFAKYIPCQSVFMDTTCTAVEFKKPVKKCDDGDIYSYKLNFTAPTVDALRNGGLCIPAKELNDTEGKLQWAHKVDSAVTRYIASMKSALQRACVQTALRDNKVVDVEVIGWTDPRGINDACLYTGKTIDFNKSWVKLNELEKKTQYIPNGILKSNTPFSKSGASGNQLLSDVRAYYTALLLDSVWTERVPEYRKLKYHNPPLLRVVAMGKAIQQQVKNAGNQTDDYSKRRSANVIVRVPGVIEQPDPLKVASGRFVSLTGLPCAVLYNRQVAPPVNPSVGYDETTTQQQPQTKKTETRKEIPVQTPIEQPKQKQETRKAVPVATPQPERENKCYTVFFAEYQNEDEANALVDKLLHAGMENVKRIVYYDQKKTMLFRVISGCYENQSIASNAQLKAKDIVRTNNLTVKPTVLLSADQEIENDNSIKLVGVMGLVSQSNKVYYDKIVEYISSKPQYQLFDDNTYLVEKRTAGIATSPTIWYYSERSRQIAQNLARDLTALTGIGFSVQRGSGNAKGTPEDLQRTIIVHVIAE
ncbi:MAG: hypothetical protein U0Y96_15835 [Candidatus Kapaibacterium sp.]